MRLPMTTEIHGHFVVICDGAAVWIDRSPKLRGVWKDQCVARFNFVERYVVDRDQTRWSKKQPPTVEHWLEFVELAQSSFNITLRDRHMPQALLDQVH